MVTLPELVEFRGRSSTKTQPGRLSIFGHRTGWTNGKTMVGGIDRPIRKVKSTPFVK